MAVPIPVKKQYAGKMTGSLGESRGFRLEYLGRKPQEEILATAAGSYVSHPDYTGGENRLYHADNLPVLAALAQDEAVAGKVRLVYIDPPFATAASFESRKQKHAYNDHLTGPAFVESLRERLILIHHLLADDGSLYLHLDERMIFHFRIILDEIFGEKNFRNCIVRKKCNPKNSTRKTYGNISDYILFYTKNDSYVWNRPLEPWNEEKFIKGYPCVESDGRRYKKVPVHAPGVRNGETGKEWRGKLPPSGKHWQYTPAMLDEMDARGEIYWSPTGNPRRKIYLENSKGIPVQNIWLDFLDAHNQNIHVTGYPTEKNINMLHRIISASSNKGDIVLDCYAGSGTTLHAASRLGRKWIGVDISTESITTILSRFTNGTSKMGDFIKGEAKSVQMPLFQITDFTLFEDKNRIHSCL